MRNSAQLDVKDWQTKRYTDPEMQIEELFRNYNVSTELIKRTTNQQELLDLILEEYIDRLDEIPGVDLVNVDELDFKVPVRSKLRSLILFASQAVLLKEKADLFRELEVKNKKLRETTTKLDKKNEKLKEMNQQYLNMLGFVSHELRSPLISILGFAELMNEGVLGKLNEEQKKAVNVIMRSSNSLIDMIQNYLDLAKIEQGEMSLEKKPVDLHNDILLLVFEEMEEQFQKKELNISVESDQETNSVECDVRLIRIVLNNLISNAVKYGEEKGDLLVRFSHEKNSLKIVVLNTGQGMNQKELKKIFQKFSQGDGTRKRGYRSSGLGLYNSKYIIKKHGGKIWAESEFGKWFKVTFTLPFSK
jgi:signal transduction histidine kinase